MKWILVCLYTVTKTQKNKPLGNNFLFSLTSLGLCGFGDTSEIAITVSQMVHLFQLFSPPTWGLNPWASQLSSVPNCDGGRGSGRGRHVEPRNGDRCHENMSSRKCKERKEAKLQTTLSELCNYPKLHLSVSDSRRVYFSVYTVLFILCMPSVYMD